MIKISMNGGVSKAQNPYVPITVEEYAAEIGQFLQLGIKHFHIHFRDAGGKESLEQEVVLPQFLALKKRFPNCQIGIGSPLQNGMTAAKRQKAIAAWTWRPDYISVNVCEEGSCALSKTLQQLQVPIEYGIFTLADAEEFVARQYSQSAFRVLIEVSGEATDEATVEKAAAILTGKISIPGQSSNMPGKRAMPGALALKILIALPMGKKPIPILNCTNIASVRRRDYDEISGDSRHHITSGSRTATTARWRLPRW